MKSDRNSTTEKSDLKFDHLALGLLLIGFVLLLWIGYLVPIYTDELTFKIIHARIFLDQGKAISLCPQCNQDFTTTWPFYFAPIRWIDALFYADLGHPLKLRIIGIAIFLLILFVEFLAVRPLFPPSPTRNVKSLAVILSIGSFGVYPLLMVMNRPEQILTLCCHLLLFLPLFINVRRFRILTMIIIGMTNLVLLAYHPKTLLFLPFLLIIWWNIDLSRLQKLVGVTTTLTLALGAHYFYHKFFACPNDPYLARLLASFALTPGAFFAHPLRFLEIGWSNLSASNQYIENVLLKHVYMSDWLPRDPERHGVLSSFVNFSTKLLWVGQIQFVFISAVRQGLKLRSNLSQLRSVALYLSLACSLVLLFFFQIHKNSYESILVLPVIFSLSVYAVSFYPSYLIAKYHKKVLSVLIMIGILSQAVTISIFYPYALGSWRTTGNLPAQPFSIAGMKYDIQNKKTLDLAAQCGLHRGPNTRHLVIDDLTYPAFWDTREPFHALYITGGYWDRGIPSLSRFLEERHVAGWITHCRFLPEDLRAVAKTDGLLCCLPPFE